MSDPLREKFDEVLEDQPHAEALALVDGWLSDATIELPEEQVLSALALLTDEEYETRRRAAAKRLGYRPSKIDGFIAKRRPKENDEETAGSAFTIVDDDPWPDAVSLAPLLDELAAKLREYIIFQNEHDSHALALWIVVTYCADLFNVAPLVGVTAISKECGKTSLLRILLHLVYRGKATISLTTATCFRIVDKYHPTLIADEVDNWLENNPELMTIFLAGHEREFSKVERCVGDENDIREFDCFGPKVWGQIDLPDGQLVSRSLVIKLMKKKQDEKVTAWPRVGMPDGVKDAFSRLRRQSLRWARDNQDAIKSSKPEVAGLGNRLQDNWYPLLVIASLAGDEWKNRAIQAAGGTVDVDEEGEQMNLLRDVRDIFHEKDIDRIPVWALLEQLLTKLLSPWPSYDRQREGLTMNQLGRKLSAMGVKSKPIHISTGLATKLGWSSGTQKGYQAKQFTNLFDRHLGGAVPPVEVVEME